MNKEQIENDALKAIVEHAYTLISKTNAYTPELNALYRMLGRACGKADPEDPADWSALPNMVHEEEQGGVRIKKLRW